MITCPSCNHYAIVMSFHIQIGRECYDIYDVKLLCRNCGEQEIHGYPAKDLIMEEIKEMRGVSASPPSFHNPQTHYQYSTSGHSHNFASINFDRHNCVFCGRDVRSASGIVTAEGIALCLRCRNDDSRKEEVDAILH